MTEIVIPLMSVTEQMALPRIMLWDINLRK
jgi:hypothetical protein